MTSSHPDPPTVRVLHLYDAYLNIYADRGNIDVIRRRLAWRGIGCEVRGLALGDTFEPGAADLLYVGGGQDRDQRLIAEAMATDLAGPIASSIEAGCAVLAVCGGYQLLGRSYRDVSGAAQPGVGVLGLETEAGETRLIGNVAIDCELPAIGPRAAVRSTVVGFENHAGRTILDAGAQPLGQVVHGHGNDGASGFEGCRRQRCIGTYLHGPLLPRNPQLADWLLAAALAHATGDDEAALRIDTPLPAGVTGLEQRAHDAATRRAAAEPRAGRRR